MPGDNDDFYNKLFNLGIGLGTQVLGGNDPQVEKAGYQGGIPDYIASRTAVPGTNNPARRPGSGGQRYFTDINFEGPAADTAGLAALNAANPSLESSLPMGKGPAVGAGGLFAPLRSPALNRVYDSFEGFTGPKTPAEAGQTGRGTGISLTPEFKKYLQESGYSIDETPMGTDRPTVIYNPQGQQVSMTDPASVPAVGPRPTQMFAGAMAAEEAKRNPNIEPGFYSSPEYQAIPGGGQRDAIQTKYFGQIDGHRRGQDAAYEAYLTRTGQTDRMLQTPISDPSSSAFDSFPLYQIPTQMYAGGIAQLNSGAYLNGASDGMADRIPATIEGSQEARLSDGEFVIPADVVGGLGNGNSSAGAKTLYNMMDRVRMARTGTKKQGTQINPNKMMPV